MQPSQPTKSENKKNLGSTFASFEYAPSIESSSIVKIHPKNKLFINGKFVEPKSKKYFKTINPATEETLAEIAEANAQDVDLAVKAARHAYKNTWSKISGAERGKYLFRVAR